MSAPPGDRRQETRKVGTGCPPHGGKRLCACSAAAALQRLGSRAGFLLLMDNLRAAYDEKDRQVQALAEQVRQLLTENADLRSRLGEQ